jgi:RNA-directed DNA polymerase
VSLICGSCTEREKASVDPATGVAGFLGFAFRPREAINRETGERFTSFSPAISPEALKAKGDRLRELRIHRRTNLTLNDLAAWLNPIVAGWMRYCGRFYRSALDPLLRRVSST